MRLALAALLVALASPALAAGLAEAEVRRGMAAVGEKTSDQPALRAHTAAPSASFRIGAAFRAWHNAAAALDNDSKNTTGDGGDDEVVAIDCGDERLAFASLETARTAGGASEGEVIAATGAAEAGLAQAWRARQTIRPAACH